MEEQEENQVEVDNVKNEETCEPPLGLRASLFRHGKCDEMDVMPISITQNQVPLRKA